MIMSVTTDSTKVLLRIPNDINKVIERIAKERYQTKTTVIVELLRLQVKDQIQETQRPFDGVQKR